MDRWLLVSTTLPDREKALEMAQMLVEQRLAACAQTSGPITSTYRWRGEIETAEEWYCLAKTTRAAYARLETAVRARHPYELPEIVATPLADGNAGYLQWIEDEVQAPELGL